MVDPKLATHLTIQAVLLYSLYDTGILELGWHLKSIWFMVKVIAKHSDPTTGFMVVK